jgi:hypothetical protein
VSAFASVIFALSELSPASRTTLPDAYDPVPPRARPAGWYRAYLEDALEPSAVERRLPEAVPHVASLACEQEASIDLRTGLDRAADVQAGWVAEHRRADGTFDPATLAHGLGCHPRWALPRARAADVAHERNALLALWAGSTPRNARLWAWARRDHAAFAGAIWELRCTVAAPERTWFLSTRPTGARLAGQFLWRVLEGQPVEGVRMTTDEPVPPAMLRAEGGELLPPDVVALAAQDGLHEVPEARLVAAVLTCAQHSRTCRREGGLARVLAVVAIARCPELRPAVMPHEDEELLSSATAVLRLWDGVCAAIELPIRRWLRGRVQEEELTRMAPLWGWSSGAIDAGLLQGVLDEVAGWVSAELRPRLIRTIERFDEPLRDALDRFYVRGQSLRNVGRQLSPDAADQVAAATAALEAVLPRLAGALQHEFTSRRAP